MKTRGSQILKRGIVNTYSYDLAQPPFERCTHLRSPDTQPFNCKAVQHPRVEEMGVGSPARLKEPVRANSVSAMQPGRQRSTGMFRAWTVKELGCIIFFAPAYAKENHLNGDVRIIRPNLYSNSMLIPPAEEADMATVLTNYLSSLTDLLCVL